MKSFLFLLVFVAQTALLSAQKYVLPNEIEIFSFETDKGKKLSICKDKADKYIVYRFGTKKKVELEYPSVKNKQSWEKFTFSSYFRGGGEENDGMDLNSLKFTNGGYEYEIYDDYTAEGEKTTVGVVVKQLSNKKEVKIEGNPKTRKGSLVNLRDNELIKQGEGK
jgi:hypothetical protein